jgi:hypothetical protein
MGDTAMSNGTKGDGGKGNPNGVYLVIPYYPDDMGSRPLPSAYPFWSCQSIHLGGSPYAGQKLVPGQTVELAVEAINYGAQTASAVCIVFWANPTTSFTNASVNFIGTAPLTLAAHAVNITGPISWTIPEGTPEHICLLAEVTAPADPIQQPATYDAATDRHYAQQNVQVLTATPGQQIRIGFFMANPGVVKTKYWLEVTHLAASHQSLRHILPRSAVLIKAQQIHLKTPSHARSQVHKLDVELDRGESLEVELSALVPADAKPGSTIVLQALQYQHLRHQPVGGLGVVVHVI